MGVVQQSIHAHLKQANVSEGATIYPGEELSTDFGGSLSLSASGVAYRLLESSRAFFYPSSTGPVTDLQAGGITFRKQTGGSNLAIVASDVRVVTKGEGAATGQVFIVSPCEVRVSAVLGQLDVVSGDEDHVIKEKETYSVTPEHSVADTQKNLSPDDPDFHKQHTHKSCAAAYVPRRGGPPVGSGSSHFLKILAIGGGAAALLLLWPKGSSSDESPSRP